VFLIGQVSRLFSPVGAENCVTSCDLHVFVDEAAEAVSSLRLDGCVGT
jgi:hypothetical protein